MMPQPSCADESARQRGQPSMGDAASCFKRSARPLGTYPAAPLRMSNYPPGDHHGDDGAPHSTRSTADQLSPQEPPKCSADSRIKLP